MQGSHKFMTSNSQPSWRHVVSIYHNDRTFLKTLAKNQILTMAVKDNEGITLEREASITEIQAQLVSL